MTGGKLMQKKSYEESSQKELSALLLLRIK